MTPSAPSPPGARLAAVLKELKQRTGLSLAQLAHATTFSKSSWERYLNGKSLPPRSAVKELCRLVSEPADHPLALLDIARTDPTDRMDRTDPTDHADQAVDSGTTRGTSAARQRTGTRTDTPASAVALAPPDTGRSETVPSDAGHIRTGPAGYRRATVLTALASVCAVVLGTLVLIHLPHRNASRRHRPPRPLRPPGRSAGDTACRNKDPLTMKCAAEPLTLAEHETATGAWIQIRYSQECGTSWARMWGAAVDDRVEIRTGGRDGTFRGARVTSRGEADTYVHTPMSVVSPGTSVQACFSPAAGGGKECFETRADQAVFAP